MPLKLLLYLTFYVVLKELLSCRQGLTSIIESLASEPRFSGKKMEGLPECSKNDSLFKCTRTLQKGKESSRIYGHLD